MLFRDKAEEIARFGLGLGSGNMPAGEVAGADIIYFPLANGILECAPQLIPGYIPVHVMHLVQLNMIGLQTLQRAVQMTSDFIG
ncbi:hypothetical protein D3C86_2012930 [compost metagenome]